jgi:hypothetical protein
VGAAAGAARYTAARVRVHVDVRVDDGGDAVVADLLQPRNRVAACSTALQVECTTSSEALMAVLPGGVGRVAETHNGTKSLHAHCDN